MSTSRKPRPPLLRWSIFRMRALEREIQVLRDALTVVDGYALTVSLTTSDESEQLIAQTVLNTTQPALRRPIP